MEILTNPETVATTEGTDPPDSTLIFDPENPWWHLKGQDCSVTFNLPIDKWPLTPSPARATILGFKEDSVLLKNKWGKSSPFWCARKYIQSIGGINLSNAESSHGGKESDS